jgi:hypothetical protein
VYSLCFTGVGFLAAILGLYRAPPLLSGTPGAPGARAASGRPVTLNPVTKASAQDPLQRASRSLRLKTRHNQALDTVEVLTASAANHRGGLLVFAAPASLLNPDLLLSINRTAHQNLPMVEARLRAMGSERQRQYVRITRSDDGVWSCVVANLRLRRAGRITPVTQHVVRLPATALLPKAVEVACRRARLALLDLDPSATPELEERFIDELVASEAELLRLQIDLGC